MTESKAKAPIVLLGKESNSFTPVDTWPAEDRQTAFQVYIDPQQGRRSLRQTARLTGIPYQTLSRWNVQESWQLRLWEADERQAQAVKQSVQMRLVNELDAAMDTLIELMHTGTLGDKVRFDAVKLALGIASFSEVKKVEADIVTDNVTKAKKGPQGGGAASEPVAAIAARLNSSIAEYAASSSIVEGESSSEEKTTGEEERNEEGESSKPSVRSDDLTHGEPSAERKE